MAGLRAVSRRRPLGRLLLAILSVGHIHVARSQVREGVFAALLPSVGRDGIFGCLGDEDVSFNG